MPDGNVFINPYGRIGNAIVFNTATNVVSNLVGTQGLNGFLGVCTDPTGNIVMMPGFNNRIGIYNPYNGQFSSLTISGSGYWGCQVIPNGNVVCFPQNTNFVGQYNPFTRQFSTFVTVGAGGNGFRQGTLLPDGRVVMSEGSRFGIYNYKNNTFTSFVFPTSTGGTMCLCLDGRLLTSGNGNVMAMTATTRPVPPEFGMHPFFNRS
jgi:hypothetical protein